MPTVTINYVAVIVAAIASMVIGAIWYAMPVFGGMWMRLIGKTKEELTKGRGPAYAGMFIMSLLLSYVLAHFVGYTTATTIGAGALTGFWIWLGFVVPVMAGDTLFAKKPMGLFWIGAGYYLVQLLVMGAILAMWQ